MTVFIRTPNLTLPMDNPNVTAKEQEIFKDGYDAIFEKRNKTFGGFAYDFCTDDWRTYSPEQLDAFYERIWERKGFQCVRLSTTYGSPEPVTASGLLPSIKRMPILSSIGPCTTSGASHRSGVKVRSDPACRHKKTAGQIKDPKKRAILAPEEPPHTFGTVRPSLQVSYYDVINQDNVDVVSVKSNPIKTFTPTGVELADGTRKDVDVVVLATGYDTHTGGFKQIDIVGRDGLPLAKHWEQGCKSYLGLGTSHFPNMCFTCTRCLASLSVPTQSARTDGPHGPTAYSKCASPCRSCTEP
jgi:cation diffusion facilitator CzcD-associated flavoprotein CzcO